MTKLRFPGLQPIEGVGEPIVGIPAVVDVQIPFDGFYETWYADECDRPFEDLLEYDRSDIREASDDDKN